MIRNNSKEVGNRAVVQESKEVKINPPRAVNLSRSRREALFCLERTHVSDERNKKLYNFNVPSSSLFSP